VGAKLTLVGQKPTMTNYKETNSKMNDPIGAVVKIRWNDTQEIAEGYYFSFEEFPEGADEDYVLPLAKITDSQVFMYCSVEDFAGLVKNHNEFIILDYLVITPDCETIA
jgi:hypothetical protein